MTKLIRAWPLIIQRGYNNIPHLYGSTGEPHRGNSPLEYASLIAIANACLTLLCAIPSCAGSIMPCYFSLTLKLSSKSQMRDYGGMLDIPEQGHYECLEKHLSDIGPR